MDGFDGLERARTTVLTTPHTIDAAGKFRRRRDLQGLLLLLAPLLSRRILRTRVTPGAPSLWSASQVIFATLFARMRSVCFAVVWRLVGSSQREAGSFCWSPTAR